MWSLWIQRADHTWLIILLSQKRMCIKDGGWGWLLDATRGHCGSASNSLKNENKNKKTMLFLLKDPVYFEWKCDFRGVVGSCCVVLLVRVVSELPASPKDWVTPDDIHLCLLALQLGIITRAFTNKIYLPYQPLGARMGIIISSILKMIIQRVKEDK